MNPIKRLRLDLGITQLAFGRLLGLSESKVSKLETGRVEADSELLAKIEELRLKWQG
jgi:transcriptional regulator with XRE-family HTH domain